jgi:TatA/E family protein of Tat protein translocase
MLGLGLQALLVILVIVLLIFGGKKLPEIANGLGMGDSRDRPIRSPTRHADGADGLAVRDEM